MTERPCYGCGGDGERKTVYVTNGVLILCDQCLSDLNHKNPILAELRHVLDQWEGCHGNWADDIQGIITKWEKS